MLWMFRLPCRVHTVVTPTVFAAITEKPKSCSLSRTTKGGRLVNHVEVNLSDLSTVDSGYSADSIAFATEVPLPQLLNQCRFLSQRMRAWPHCMRILPCSWSCELRYKAWRLKHNWNVVEQEGNDIRLQSVRDQFFLYVFNCFCLFSIKHTGYVVQYQFLGNRIRYRSPELRILPELESQPNTEYWARSISW